MHRLFLAIGFLFLPLACAPAERLPGVPWTGSQAALRVLDARAKAVRSASARCQITLTRPDGQSVRLEGALAMKPPEAVRLRAWKMGQAVFDLTLTPAGLWIVAPPEAGGRERVLPAGADAGRILRAWALFSGEFCSGEGARVIDKGGRRFEVEREIENLHVVCEVDRATLTPRVYRMTDPSGARRLTLTEDRYVEIGGIPWPTRLIAASDSGTIAIDLSDIELNGTLPPGAFVPPRRAEKVQ